MLSQYTKRSLQMRCVDHTSLKLDRTLPRSLCEGLHDTSRLFQRLIRRRERRIDGFYLR